MAKIYKISIYISLVVVIFAVGNYVMAQSQGKGYFYEQGNNFYILDNLQIYGYLAVESNITNKTGAIGDVLVENNLILDKDSVINFCRDLPGNTNCADKALVWQGDKLDVSNTKLNEIQANKILALNKDIYLESNASVIATGQVNLQGCFSNDGGSISCVLPHTCAGGGNIGKPCTDDTNCPNSSCNLYGELRTSNFYTNNLTSLTLKTAAPKNRPEIKITANKLTFNKLNLGEAADHINLCWNSGAFVLTPGTTKCLPAKGDTFTKPAFLGIYGLALKGDQLCCYLDVSAALSP